MTKVTVYTMEGKESGDIALPGVVFGLASNDALVHQVYVAQDANRRSGSAHTKIRSEVRGGGRKPWKQKGTGNARTGSIRNPIWRGGGIIFGPRKERNFTKQINTKMRRKALVTALSEKARAGKVIIIDSFVLPEIKTKFMTHLFDALAMQKSATVGLSDNEHATYRAIRNIQKVTPIETTKLNVYDILNTEYIFLSKESIVQLEKQFSA